jgi:hypothetical protein
MIVMFSGGCDSWTIIDSCIKAGVLVDEIWSFGGHEWCDPNDKSRNPNNLANETRFAAIPEAKKFQQRDPRIKYKVFDATRLIEDYWKKNNPDAYEEHWISPEGPVREIVETLDDQHVPRSSFNRIVRISGIDKPRIMYDMATGNFGCYFHDLNTIFGKFSEETLSGYIPKIEYFYYTTDLPTLMQKQCFVLKHTLIEKAKLTPATAKEIITKVKDNRFIIYNSHTPFFRTTLYSKWNDNTWQADKDTTNYFYQSNSKWFHTDKFTEKRFMDYYEGQVNELINGVDEIFIERSNGKVNKFIDFISSPIIF